MGEWPTETDDSYAIQAGAISLDKGVHKVLEEMSRVAGCCRVTYSCPDGDCLDIGGLWDLIEDRLDGTLASAKPLK